MSRNVKTMISIVGIIVLMGVISVLVYYSGEHMAKMFLGAKGTKLPEWMHYYENVVTLAFGVSSICLLSWYSMTRFVKKVIGPDDGNERMLWYVFLALSIAAGLVIPYGYAIFINSRFTMHIMIALWFVVMYGLVGYWLGSIFFTSAAYKYIPVGAVRFRAPKGQIGGNN